MKKQSHITYTLLENGLDFIHQSLLDFSKAKSATSKKSNIKYSVLHLSSGIELIFKNHLLNEHWTYIFADMNKATKKNLEDGDFQSVNLKQIFDRLDNLCDIKINEQDKKELDTLRKQRNKLEHFECNVNIQYLSKLITDSMKITIKILNNYYDKLETADEEEELLDKIKLKLKDLETFYDNALELAKTMAFKDKGEDYNFLQCPVCSEKLLTYGNNDSVSCFFCNYNDTPERAADLYISDILDINHYQCIKDGGEWPLEICPECNHYSLVNTGGGYICFNCNEASECYIQCEYCGKLINSNDDNDMDICTECLDYKMSKD